jgi:hypothetical protein
MIAHRLLPGQIQLALRGELLHVLLDAKRGHAA